MIHELTVGIDQWSEYQTLDGVFVHRVEILPGQVDWIYVKPKHNTHIVYEIRDYKGQKLGILSLPKEVWTVGDQVKFKVEP